MGTRPDPRLSTRGVPPALTVCPCSSAPALPRGSQTSGHPPRALAAKISPLVLLLPSPVSTSPPQALINSCQGLLAAPWRGC